jgi:hypothetical protein
MRGDAAWCSNLRVIFSDVTRTVGGTPLVELGRLAGGLPGRVVAKLEMRNPCGSVKDRLGVALIDDAERRGVLRPGMTLVEATGGSAQAFGPGGGGRACRGGRSVRRAGRGASDARYRRRVHS